MNPDEYDVGYKKPPKGNRFYKGQSGNYKGRPRKPLATIADKIEGGLTRKTQIIDGECTREVTYLEIILLQIIKHMNGKNGKRALRILRKYEALAKARPVFCVVTQSKEESARLYSEFKANYD